MDNTFLSEYRDILSPHDIQVILQTGRNTVYHYLVTGQIRSIKIGNKYRIPKRYLYDFIYSEDSSTNLGE